MKARREVLFGDVGVCCVQVPDLNVTAWRPYGERSRKGKASTRDRSCFLALKLPHSFQQTSHCLESEAYNAPSCASA